MAFKSIAFSPNEHGEFFLHSNIPSYFVDLNLDQILDAITANYGEYNLGPLYLTPLHDVADLEYRHEVFDDLEHENVMDIVRRFARGMREVRKRIEQANKLRHHFQKAWWFLSAVQCYCEAIREAEVCFSRQELRSPGLSGFRTSLSAYVASHEFGALAAEATGLSRDLQSIRYSLQIKDTSVTIRRDNGEQDYVAEIQEVFAKFRQGSPRTYTVEFKESVEMNHVEEAVIDRVALFYPDMFAHFERFTEHAADFIDATVLAFDREIQFYVSYLDMVTSLRRKGLKFCYPTIATEDKYIRSTEGFDLALALKLAKDGSPTVTNDFHLDGRERLFVVSGPNQGGKTTFARAFGQLHYLAALGCPVPGSEARLFRFDEIFTHFEHEEDITNLRGKLHDDLVRVKEMLDRATPDSIIILNEVFNSTTLGDEIFLSGEVLRRIIDLGCLGVCVTFIDELSDLSERTVSMMSTVDADNPAKRTYRVIRKPADGLAYAMSIAEKHRVTYAALTKRLGS